MRFDDKSNKFNLSIINAFKAELESRIPAINDLIIRMHPIIQENTCHELCITGMRIHSKLNLEESQWNPGIAGANELHLNLREHDCYTIICDDTRLAVEHRFFRSWDDDTRTLLYSNIKLNPARVKCNLDLVYPVLYALDKLEAMY